MGRLKFHPSPCLLFKWSSRNKYILHKLNKQQNNFCFNKHSFCTSDLNKKTFPKIKKRKQNFKKYSWGTFLKYHQIYFLFFSRGPVSVIIVFDSYDQVTSPLIKYLIPRIFPTINFQIQSGHVIVLLRSATFELEREKEGKN